MVDQGVSFVARRPVDAIFSLELDFCVWDNKRGRDFQIRCPINSGETLECVMMLRGVCHEFGHKKDVRIITFFIDLLDDNIGGFIFDYR